MHINDIGAWMKKNKNYEYDIDENGLLCFEDTAAPAPMNHAGKPFGVRGYVCREIETRILQKPLRERYEIAERMRDEFCRNCGGHPSSIGIVVLCDVFRIGQSRHKKIKNLYNPNERFFDEDNHKLVFYPKDSRNMKRGIIPGFLPV